MLEDFCANVLKTGVCALSMLVFLGTSKGIKEKFENPTHNGILTEF